MSTLVKDSILWMGLMHTHGTALNLRVFSEPLVVPLWHQDIIINVFRLSVQSPQNSEISVLQLARVIFVSLMAAEAKADCALWGLEMQDNPVCWCWKQTGCWPWPCYGPDPNSVANTSVEFALQGNHLTPGRKLSSIRLCVQCGQARHHGEVRQIVSQINSQKPLLFRRYFYVCVTPV